MKVLIACEFSGVVREAFRKRQHDAWSCDLEPALDNSPYHYQCDVLSILDQGWDLMIAHPPCTYLANSGVRWLKTEKGRWQLMVEGAQFFKRFLTTNIPYVAVENPIMHKYAKEIIGQNYTQLIQPYHFGHTESKATCLWLVNLPKLTYTNNVKEIWKQLPKKEGQKTHYMSPSKNRSMLRSITYQGIANAMAEQWG